MVYCQKYKTMTVKGWIQLICLLFVIITFSACSNSVDDLANQAKRYKSPEKAVNALIDRIRENDMQGLKSILGPKSERLVNSGDEVTDKVEREGFLEKYEKMIKLEKNGSDQVNLIVGEEEWSFPIPIVKGDGGWYFDVSAGLEEIMNRRIGRNELDVIGVMRAYVDAQREYYAVDHDKDGIHEYAQKIFSDEGQKNGLFWPVKPGEELSPFGPLAAEAAMEGYNKNDGQPTPYHGYYYKVLRKQGKKPSGREYNYIVNKNMILGFALVAYPAEHGNSGIMTFVVNHQDVIYEKDFGENTEQIVKGMEQYDPDETWKKN